MVMTAILSGRTSLRKCRHGFHCSASRTIAEPNLTRPPQAVTSPNPPAATLQFMTFGNHSRAGGGKGMTVGNRTAKHVEFALIDFADQPESGQAPSRTKIDRWPCIAPASVCAAKASCISIRVKSAQRQPGSFQRQRCRPRRTQQHILTNINRGKA